LLNLCLLPLTNGVKGDCQRVLLCYGVGFDGRVIGLFWGTVDEVECDRDGEQ
ncbi:hypothetical protein Tco_0421075, partial [Tanacetum coccineum]